MNEQDADDLRAEILTETRAQVVRVKKTLEELGTVSERLGSAEERLDSASDRVASLTEVVGRLSEHLDRLATSVEELRPESLTERLARIQSEGKQEREAAHEALAEQLQGRLVTLAVLDGVILVGVIILIFLLF